MTYLLIGGFEFAVADTSPAVVPHLEPAGEAPDQQQETAA